MKPLQIRNYSTLLKTVKCVGELGVVDEGAEITPDVKSQLMVRTKVAHTTIQRHLNLLAIAGFLKGQYDRTHGKTYRLQYPLVHIIAKLEDMDRNLSEEEFGVRKGDIVVSEVKPIELLTSTRGADEGFRRYGEHITQVWKRICQEIPVGHAQEINKDRVRAEYHLKKLFKRAELPKDFIVIQRGPYTNKRTYIVHLSPDQSERQEQLKRLGFIEIKRTLPKTRINTGAKRWIDFCMSMEKGQTKSLKMQWPAVPRRVIKRLIERSFLPDEFEIRTSGNTFYVMRKAAQPINTVK